MNDGGVLWKGVQIISNHDNEHEDHVCSKFFLLAYGKLKILALGICDKQEKR